MLLAVLYKALLNYELFWDVQYIPRNMHTFFALLCFVVVIHWLIFPYPSGLLHWHCGNLTIAPVPAKQPWWIWINTSCELIMNDCITTTKQSTTKPCAYFLGYTVQCRMYIQAFCMNYSPERRRMVTQPRQAYALQSCPLVHILCVLYTKITICNLYTVFKHLYTYNEI